MKHNAALALALLGLITLFAFPGISRAKGDFAIGSVLEEFRMQDPAGIDRSYSELKGEKGTLIIFLSAQCPVVKMYDQRINAFAESLKAKGINFVGIYSNNTESVKWVREHSEATYRFPVLIDKNNVLADKLGATRTPEVYYFNADDILDYHGAIDNDRSGNNISKYFLKTAVEQKLSGKEITEKVTKAFGCSIKRVGDAEGS